MDEAEPIRLSWWKTLLGASLVLSCTLFGRLVSILGVGMGTGRLDPFAENAREQLDGWMLAVGVLGASLMGGLALVFVLRKQRPLRYLALDDWNAKHIALGLLLSLALVVVLDGLRFIMTGSLVSPLWTATYGSAASVPLLTFALGVVAPIVEESVFRGFLQPGLAQSRLGPAGAILVVSLLFMLAHKPTDWLSALEPLAIGILLGVVRHQTRSTTSCIVMHAFITLQAIATVKLVGA